MQFRNKNASTKDFGLVPRADIPRSTFRIQTGLLTAFNASDLVPVFIAPVNPGDTIKLKGTYFARLATPLFPFMDNLYLDTFWFFGSCRILWDNWVKFMGEQTNPGDSISYTMPQTSGHRPAVGSLWDYFGLPTEGQIVNPNTITHTILPGRLYNKTWNQWFRDENLQNSIFDVTDDGPNNPALYVIQKRNKRPDYFTTCLPSPQKGSVAVTTPLTGTAPVYTNTVSGNDFLVSDSTLTNHGVLNPAGVNVTWVGSVPGAGNLFADLTAASAATINELRTAITLQQFLEKDARGGTRYIEINLSHWNVHSPDARLQRVEYLGGGSQNIAVRPVEQTSESSGSSPQGNLAAFAEVVAHNGFHQSFTEHGYIMGLVNVRAQLRYQQGIERHWKRSTRYDWPWPVFANLGEQAILSQEIYADGTAGDLTTFGYQERYAEERDMPSKITGLMRSTAANTIDAWHLAQDFATRPTLNTTFIAENVPLSRILAVGASAAGQEIIMDALFTIEKTTSLPTYGVPGLLRF